MSNTPFSFLFNFSNLRFKHVFLIFIGFLTIVMLSFFFLGYQPPEELPDRENIYKTWKLETLYKNGKPIRDSKKFANLKLKINRNGTAEWIRPGNKLTINFKVNEDASQIVIDDGYTVEDIETIFELKPNKLRFGKRNIASRYEYVLVPAEEIK